MDLVLNWWIFPAMIVVSAGFGLALIPLAQKTGLVDHPGHRKVHETVTPLTGGPAIFIALAAFFAWHMPDDPFVQALALGATLMFLTGLIDDRHHLSPITRFIVQVAACLVMVVWAGVYLDDFGQLFTSYVLEIGPLAIPITIFAALGVINSFNMIDGMDGLSGGIFLVAAAGMALFAWVAREAVLYWVLLLSIAAVFGFLLLNARFPWNKKARVFLGDSGSMLLGFILAWCFIGLGNDHNETGERAMMPITAVWLFGVPLLDTTTQMWRRWRAGNSPLLADQFHLHHAFLRAGYSVQATWAGIMLLALGLAVMGIGFELTGLPDYASFWTFMAFAFTYYFYMKRSWRIQRFLGRDFIYNDFDEPTS